MGEPCPSQEARFRQCCLATAQLLFLEVVEALTEVIVLLVAHLEVNVDLVVLRTAASAEAPPHARHRAVDGLLDGVALHHLCS